MIVKKAGTILLNLQTKKIGLVYRDSENDYTFPKGHLEKGETLEECAVRETEEETLRANHLLINKEICINTYTTPSGENVENYMYIAIDDGPTSKNIDIKDQENLKWISPDDVENILTYDNLKELWNKIKSPIKDIFENNGNISPAILTDLGICPTCYDKEKVQEIRNLIKSINSDFVNNLKIRLAKYTDCTELSYLKREIWETTYRGVYPDEKIDNYNYINNTEKFKSYIDNPNQQLFVVTDNNVIIAYIEFGKPFRPFEDYKQEIGLFYIRKDYQGIGLGKKLFDFAYNNIKTTNVDKFFISCHKYNLNAQKFYEKMGGKLVKIDEDFANNGLPQIKFEFKIK